MKAGWGGIAALCIAAAVPGCAGMSGIQETSPNLLVLAAGNDGVETIRREYGNPYLSAYPDASVEYVSFSPANLDQATDELIQTIDRERPDVLILGESQYERLAGENKLFPLDPLIRSDDDDTAGMFPGVLEKLRGPGGGGLFGLSPMFTGRGVVFNKDLFDAAGIEYPADGMTWEQLLRLAEQFSARTEPATFGFSFPGGPEALVDQIARTNGLLLFDESTGEPLIENEAWREVWESVVGAYRSGAIAPPSDRDEFMDGRAAMAIATSDSLYRNFRRHWGVAAFPVHPTLRSETKEYYVDNILAIPAEAEDVEHAWVFIRYVTGEEYARTKRLSVDRLLTRTDYARDLPGIDIDVFHSLALSVGRDALDQASSPEYDDASRIADRLRAALLPKAIAGDVSVEEALGEISEELQAVGTGSPPSAAQLR